MLSISKLGGAGQASSYYEKADYYTKGEDKVDIVSTWSGSLAKEYGLEGEVSKKEFTKLLKGELPTGEKLGTVRDGKNQHTPGWDLTFSAPKSVSILALVGDDKKLMAAHQESVAKTLDYVEKNVLNGRIYVDGKTIPVDINKALFAQFTHTTSRKLDPQLHTHSVLLNVGKDKHDGTRSIQSQAVFDSKMLLGQIYRSELAARVSKLGYNVEWDSKTGLFEIGGVDKELIKDFSKRSGDIQQVAKELGIESAKGLDKVAVGSRDSKQNISGNALENLWESQVKSKNLDSSKLVSDAKKYTAEYNKQNPKGLMGGRFVFHNESMSAVQKAVEHLSYYEAAFQEKDLLIETLKFTRENVSIDKITASLKELKKRGVVIDSASRKGMLTTLDAVKQEKSILKIEESGRDTQRPISNSDEINKALKSYSFTPGQEAGFRHLMLNTDRFTAIQGYAGVGKTYMLAPFNQAAKSLGYEVKAVAPYGAAANKLGQELGVEGATLKSLLFELKKESDSMKGKQKTLGSDADKRIYIVDESSTINSPDMAALMKAVSENGGRVIFAGDRVQLGGVERGKTFAQLQDNGMSTSINTDIVRQKKGTDLYNSIESMYKRDFVKSFKSISDRTIELASKDERVKQFAADFVEASKADKSHVGIIMDNKTREEVTDLIRDAYKENGTISKEELSVKTYIPSKVDGAKKGMAQFYEKGMQVRFLQTYKRLGVEKDQYFSVVSSNTRDVTLTDGKRVFKWKPDKIGGNNKEGGVSTYSEKERKFSVGDSIRFKDKNTYKNYINGTEGKIVEIKDGQLVVEYSDGRRVTIDPSKHREKHFEHAYISTAYIAQGMTGKTAQVLAESYQKNLLNDSSFLVGITRPKDNITIYMDSKEKVLKAVSERSGIKQGALDHQINNTRTDRALDLNSRSNDLPKSMDTFASKPAEVPKEMPKQIQREKTFLP